jgi:hypothetical protein
MVMKILLLLLFSSFIVLNAAADGIVLNILNPEELKVQIDAEDNIHLNRRVVIVSHLKNKVVAFGRVTKVSEETTPKTAVVAIMEVIDNSLVMVDDVIFPLDFKRMKKYNIPGFSSLTLEGDDDIPAQYKELAYFGVFTAEGHTLDGQEFLISPFQFQYGITNDLGVKVVNALWLDGYLNAGLKYRVLRNKHAKITLNTFGAYKVQSQDYIWQTGAAITLPSNAKFQSHLLVNITLDPQFQEARATSGLGLFQNSDIRSITEYVTDGWNRVLYGPSYSVELQTFGGTVSYMWIWDTFHISLGLGTRDLSRLRFDEDGYYWVYDFFWRF